MSYKQSIIQNFDLSRTSSESFEKKLEDVESPVTPLTRGVDSEETKSCMKLSSFISSDCESPVKRSLVIRKISNSEVPSYFLDQHEEQVPRTAIKRTAFS